MGSRTSKQAPDSCGPSRDSRVPPNSPSTSRGQEVIQTWELIGVNEEFDTRGIIEALPEEFNTLQLVDQSKSSNSSFDSKVSSSAVILTNDTIIQPNKDNLHQKKTSWKIPEQLCSEKEIANHIILAKFTSRILEKKRKIIFYFASRSWKPNILKDCQDTKRILQGYGVHLDERDLSMDLLRFREELHLLLGIDYGGILPRVFVGDEYIGGAEEIMEVHLSGKLQSLLEGCKKKKIGEDGNFEICPGCGDLRFVKCTTCWGGFGIHTERPEEGEDIPYRPYKIIRGCKACNEYGLTQCPVCW